MERLVVEKKKSSLMCQEDCPHGVRKVLIHLPILMDFLKQMSILKEKFETAWPIVTTKTIQSESKKCELLYSIDDENKELIEAILSRKDSDYSTLIVSWWVGTWKTFLSKAIFPDYYFISEQNMKQRLVSWQLVLRSPKEIECDIRLYPLEALYKLPWVIYDDFGCSEPTEAYIEKMLFRLQRMESKNRKTIITTNLSLQDMKKRDERIYSRMMQNTMVILSKGRDRRLSNTKVVKL